MILRVFDLSAPFDCEDTLAYMDFECDNYQVFNGQLEVMRHQAGSLYIPLTSIKMYKVLLEEAQNVDVST